MTEAGYRKRLAADLPKWLETGWVTSDGAAAILDSLGAGRRSAFGVAAILGTLGGLFLGLAVLAFIGSNWESMPRVAKLALIVVALLAAYATAFQFDRRGFRVFAEAATLVAGLIFAAAIVLVGQTYHMAGDFGGALLLFEVGVLGAALFAGSPTMTVLALVGAGYWTWFGTVDNEIVPHWPSLVAILAGIAIATMQNSHYGRIVAVLGFMFWAAVTIIGYATAHDWSFAGGMIVLIGTALAIWAFGAAAAAFRNVPRLAALGEAAQWPGLFAILLGVGVLQLVDTPMANEQPLLIAAMVLVGAAVALAAAAFLRNGLSLIDVIAVAAIGGGAILYAMLVPESDQWSRVAGGGLVVLAATWAVWLGQSGIHPIGKTIGLVAFGAEVVYLYVLTLRDTAFTLLLGGFLLIGLAFVLYRVDRMLARHAAARAAGPAATSVVTDQSTGSVPGPDNPASGNDGARQ